MSENEHFLNAVRCVSGALAVARWMANAARPREGRGAADALVDELQGAQAELDEHWCQPLDAAKEDGERMVRDTIHQLTVAWSHARDAKGEP